MAAPFKATAAILNVEEDDSDRLDKYYDVSTPQGSPRLDEPSILIEESWKASPGKATVTLMLYADAEQRTGVHGSIDDGLMHMGFLPATLNGKGNDSGMLSNVPASDSMGELCFCLK